MRYDYLQTKKAIAHKQNKYKNITTYTYYKNAVIQANTQEKNSKNITETFHHTLNSFPACTYPAQRLLCYP